LIKTGSQTHVSIAIASLAVLLVVTAWTIGSPATLYPLTAEDGPLETLQFLLYIGGAGAFFNYWAGARRDLPFGGTLALVWALALLIMAGEEISWGQRIFGFSTPESMMENNRQAEFNLHNLEAAYRLYGSDSRPMLFIELGLGVALPLFALEKRGSQFCRSIGMPVPPVSLLPLFLGANIFGRQFSEWFLSLGFQRTVTPEIAEFLLSAALCASGVVIMHRPEMAFGQTPAMKNEMGDEWI
jgi:hypothetical protein